MIAGILSDTHDVEDSAIDGVMEEFEKRGVEHIVHCGDLESPHMVPKLFRGYPVTYALNAEQMEKPAFQNPPPGWRPTVPGQRIIDIKHVRCYVGHKRSFDFLNGTEGNLMNFLEELRNKNDGLRWVFSGHTHHQFFVQTDLVDFVNPGALQDSLDDNYEFAIVDTQKYEVIFSRIQKIAPPIKTFSVGIISDSDRISDFDPTIWGKLATEFKKRDARTIIHCGNISLKDIGRPELENFTVYYNLRPDQFYVKEPPNWHLVQKERPVVELNGYKFYVQLDLGIELLDKSEIEMKGLSYELRRKFPELNFILCGFTHNALLVEQKPTMIINPGDIIIDRNFAVLCLPRKELTFGHVPH